MSLVIGSPKAGSAELPQLIFLPLEGKGVPAETVEVLDEVLVNSIDARGKYRVVGMDDLAQMMALDRFKDLAGCDTTSCLAEIGGAIGARWMLTGSIGKLGSKLIISLRVVDTSKAAVVARAQLNVMAEEDLYIDAMDRAVGKLFGEEAEVAPAPAPASASATTPAQPPQQQDPEPPPPPQAKLDVATQPPEARVSVGGEDVGTSPVAALAVTPGEITVVAALEGHGDATEIVTLKPGEERSLELKLEPLTGDVDIVARTADKDDVVATVFLDGRSMGDTPLKLNHRVGEYDLRVLRDDVGEFEMDLEIRPGVLTSVDALLAPDITRSWPWLLGAAMALAGGGVALDVVPESSQNNDLEPLDVVPVSMYAVAVVLAILPLAIDDAPYGF